MYCIKEQRPLKVSISSMVTYSPKLNELWLLVEKDNNISRMGASLSNTLRSALVFMSSNLIDLSKNLNRFSLKLAHKIINPVPFLVKYSDKSPFPLFTPIKNKAPKTAYISAFVVDL